ncbi:hypothetical protein [Nocardiopsis flavescens]
MNRSPRAPEEGPLGTPLPSETGPKPGAAFVRVAVLMPFLGFAAALLLSFGVGDALTRLDYATGSATAPGTVLEVDRGRPVVAFTTPDGTGVVTAARGGHPRGGPPDVTVRYLPDRPEEAMVDGAFWMPPVLLAVPLLPVAVLLVLRHPSGPRALLYRAQVRARAAGRPPQGPLNLPVALRLVSGGVVTVSAAALLTASLAAFGAGDGSDLFPALGLLGAALLPVGLELLFHGALRYLERAPAAREPVPPKLFGSGVYPALLGAVAVAAPIALLVSVSMARDVDTPEQGTATVVAAGCGDAVGEARGCRDLVALEYEVDGLTYTQTADDLGIDFAPGDRARVAWDADDPSLVRVEGVR